MSAARRARIGVELVIDRVEFIRRRACKCRGLGERETRVGRDSIHVGDVMREQVGFGVPPWQGDVEGAELLEPDEGGSRAASPGGLSTCGNGARPRRAQNESQLGGPEREMILRVTRRAEERERQIAPSTTRPESPTTMFGASG